MLCKICNEESKTDICHKCGEYFKNLNDDEINNKILSLYIMSIKQKPIYVMWYGNFKDIDLRNIKLNKEDLFYLKSEYTKLGDCPLKIGLKEIIDNYEHI